MERRGADAPHQLPAYLDERYLASGAEAGGFVSELEDKVPCVVGTGRELLVVDHAVDSQPADRYKLCHLGEPWLVAKQIKNAILVNNV